MTKFIIRRFIQAIPTFFGITFLVYMIIVLAPGDPISIMYFDPDMTQETRDAIAKRLGVNDPLPLQYLRWLVGDTWKVVDEVTWYRIGLEDGTEGWLSDTQAILDPETGELSLTTSRHPLYGEPNQNAETVGRVGRRAEMELLETVTLDVRGENKGIIRGDFGRSFQGLRPPLEMIWERFPASFELNIAVILVGLMTGWIIGGLSAIWRGSLFDQLGRVVAVAGDAIPVFWLAIMSILVFGSTGLGWLPMGERCEPIRNATGNLVCPPIWDRIEFMVLPTLVLSLGGIAGWSRYIRASMLDNIHSDYIRTAKAKGLTSRQVWVNHALRNAIIPMATFLGPTLVAFYGGAVIIEQIFAWPGIGRLLLDAATAQDYPVVMASVVIGALLTIVGYILSDILYALFDPRIRLT